MLVENKAIGLAALAAIAMLLLVVTGPPLGTPCHADETAALRRHLFRCVASWLSMLV